MRSPNHEIQPVPANRIRRRNATPAPFFFSRNSLDRSHIIVDYFSPQERRFSLGCLAAILAALGMFSFLTGMFHHQGGKLAWPPSTGSYFIGLTALLLIAPSVWSRRTTICLANREIQIRDRLLGFIPCWSQTIFFEDVHQIECRAIEDRKGLFSPSDGIYEASAKFFVVLTTNRGYVKLHAKLWRRSWDEGRSLASELAKLLEVPESTAASPEAQR